MPNASFYFHPEKWHKKPPEALRRLGFRDLHLFRSHNVVAGVGFFIARPSQVSFGLFAIWRSHTPNDARFRLRRNGSLRIRLCQMLGLCGGRPPHVTWSHSSNPTPALSKASKKRRPPDWVVFSFWVV